MTILRLNVGQPMVDWDLYLQVWPLLKAWLGSVWIKSTFHLQPTGSKPISYRSNHWFDLNTKYSIFSATVEDFNLLLSVSSLFCARIMLIHAVLSYIRTIYQLKPSIYTIFGYQSVNQPTSDPYPNLQIQVTFFKIPDLDLWLIHSTSTCNLQITTYR